MSATDDAERLVGPLAAFASLPDWLAAAMQPTSVAESLVRHVPELSEGRLALLECAPQRLRAKGSDWLARYELRVAGPTGEPRRVVLVGRLLPPGAALPSAAGPAEGRERGDRGWRCVLPDLGLELATQKRDDALPALPSLVRPEPVAALLESVLHSAGYDNARIAACAPEVVRYKPGSRCTIRVRVQYADGCRGPSPVVVKTHQGDKGEWAWAAMSALWQRPDRWRRVVRLAEPLGYLPEQRVLVQGPVPEELTLKELARQAIGGGDAVSLHRLRQELACTARGLAAVHRSGATYDRTWSLAEELLEVQEVVDRLSRSVPALAPAAAPLLGVLREGTVHVPPDPAVPAHHDFRPAQVLVHGGRQGFIDFDGACMAEPALDLGRFRAKLRDIGISALGVGPWQPGRLEENLRLLDDLCEDFLAEYLRHAEVSPARVLLWETCDLFTALLHAWTKVRLLRVEPRLTVLVHRIRQAVDAG